MAYWWPPPPTAFCPFPRPLHWHWVQEVVPAKSKSEFDNLVSVPYPEPEEEEYYGCGYGANVVSPGEPGSPRNTRQAAEFGPPKGVGDYVCIGGYGAGFHWQKKSPYDRLIYYRKLVELRTPFVYWQPWSGDPESGGLAADVATEDSIHINYFDCADYNNPIRKVISYSTNSPNGAHQIKQWDPQSRQWVDEGFDFERDAGTIMQSVLGIVNVAVSAVLAYVTVNPAIVAAWGTLFSTLVSAAKPGGKINPDQVWAGIVQATGAGWGDLQVVFEKEIFKTGVLMALYADAGKLVNEAWNLRREVRPIFDALFSAIENRAAANRIPIIESHTMAKLLRHEISDDFALSLYRGILDADARPGRPAPDTSYLTGKPMPQEILADLPLDAVHLAVDAARLLSVDGDIAYLSRRKLVPFTGWENGAAIWRSTFDLTFASLVATAARGTVSPPEDIRPVKQLFAPNAPGADLESAARDLGLSPVSIPADDVRSSIRQLPNIDVPSGWGDEFTLGCYQQTDRCHHG